MMNSSITIATFVLVLIVVPTLLTGENETQFAGQSKTPEKMIFDVDKSAANMRTSRSGSLSNNARLNTWKYSHATPRILNEGDRVWYGGNAFFDRGRHRQLAA